MKFNKIGILGAGSIGCYLGANFISSGIDTVLVGRDRLAEEIREHGLRASDLTGKNISLSPSQVKCATEIEALAGRDLILVTLKSAATEDAAQQLKRVIDKSAVVVSFQNGVRNASTLSSILTESTVLAGMVPYNVMWNDGAHFYCGTSGKLVVEERADISGELLATLHHANLAAYCSNNLPGILWAKLIFNLNNSINALAGVSLREELSQAGYRKIIASTMREALAILKHAGIRPQRSGGMIPALAPYILSLPDLLFFRIAAGMLKIDPQAHSSMWQDLQRARKTEIDYINGEIVMLARKHQLAAPINSAIIALIREAETAGQAPRIPAAQLAARLGIAIN